MLIRGLSISGLSLGIAKQVRCSCGISGCYTQLQVKKKHTSSSKDPPPANGAALSV